MIDKAVGNTGCSRGPNLLVFNLRTDADDPVLGFTTQWINALAGRCQRIAVVTMSAGRLDVAANVTVISLGKERGYSEVRRLFEFYRCVFRLISQQKIDACFAHMAPLFALLFAPVAKLRRIPSVLWYAHKSTPRTLRLAEAVVDRCLSSTPEGFRVRSRKIRFVGQGIDTGVFHPPSERSVTYELTALSIGRISPIKKVDEILHAVAGVRAEGIPLNLHLVGGPATDDDCDYAATLTASVLELGLADAIVFHGPVPFTSVADFYRVGGIFLNLSDSGSLDKAILESMASGCIPVSRNEAFRRLAATHGLCDLVPGEGPDAVAACLSRLVRLDPTEKERLRAKLRTIVDRDHSLSHLVDEVMAEVQDVSWHARER